MFKEYSKAMGYLVLTIIILASVGGVLKATGVIGERILFENSFQYKEGMKQRSATLRAQLAEIDANIIKFPEKREELMAQRKVLEIQLQATQE